jgi:hypothetical protein
MLEEFGFALWFLLLMAIFALDAWLVGWDGGDG